MSNVPKLRFKEFSENYNKYKFEDIFDFSTGKNIKQNEASPDFEIPCIRYGELYHMYEEVINKVINKTNLDKSELIFSQGNEILLPSAGEDPLDIGSASALKIPNVAIGRTINILRPLTDNIYLPEYVSYYINQKLKKKISTLAKGVSISNVYNSDLKTLSINLPSKQEQKKIASFLTSVDTKIEQLTRKEELLLQYKKGVMQKIFNQEIRFKADDGSEFCDWEEKKLSTKCTIQKGSQLNKDTLTEEGNYPALNGGINPSGFTRDWNTEANTITISEGGNSCGYVNFVTTRFWSGGHNYSLQDLEQSIDAQYLYQYLKFNEEAIMRLRVGSGLPNIQKREISNFKISVPYLKEQIKIANFLLSIDFKIEQVKKQLEYIKKFKKALLQQMFV
ncbi:restriction endonuclease subunit S [Aliarcobacter butzleri]|uniref:restriction endonuclease subunit S n=1 Tax=Aliarcobacter butzleri TaxID=28197 RepID=UPI003AC0E0B3